MIKKSAILEDDFKNKILTLINIFILLKTAAPERLDCKSEYF